MGTMIVRTAGLGALVAAACQLLACTPSTPNELVLKCDGKRTLSLETADFTTGPGDVSAVLKFVLPAFALPPSETRAPIVVVQEISGSSILSAAGWPSFAGKQGHLSASDQELTVSATEQAADQNGVMQPDYYSFKISRLTGDYTASWHFPGASMSTETGRCEPFDLAADRKF